MSNEKVIVIQEIRTTWTKKSRGGSEAIQRNTVPDALRLPQSLLSSPHCSWLHHRVLYTEDHGFASPFEEEIIDNPVLRPFTVRCVEVGKWSRAAEEQVYAKFEYNRQYGGAPDRSWMEKMLIAGSGEWVQIAYNGRFSHESGWWYEKTVVNVGLFLTPLTSTAVFTRCEPKERFLAMGHLI